MESAYPLVPLGDVLSVSLDYIERPDAREYPKLSVKLYGKGVVLDTPTDGTSVLMNRHQIARAGQVILSEIWGKKGAIGFVPPEGEGALCTSHFFLFDVNANKLDARWLKALFTANYLASQLDNEAKGTTGYAAVRPKHLLACTIPLPPMPVQRRIVARIEALAGNINEAKRLKAEGLQEVRALLIGLARREDLTDDQREALGWRKATLGTVMRQVQDLVSVHADDAYPNLGIYSFGRGLFAKAPIFGISSSATVLNRVRSGQFIYSRLFAFEGSYGYVSPEYDGRYVSGEYPTFDCNPEQIRAEFLYAYFMCPDVWSVVARGSKGLGDRRQRVQPAQVLSHELWLPPIAQQNQIAAIMRKSTILAGHHAESAKELDALLPAVLDRAFRGQL